MKVLKKEMTRVKDYKYTPHPNTVLYRESRFLLYLNADVKKKQQQMIS